MWWLYPLAVLAGVMSAMQAGANAALDKALGQPMFAALVVYGAGVVAALVACPILGIALPGRAQFAAVPWWGWIGGAMGTVYVLGTLFVAERVGAAVFTGLTVTAGILTSVALDHYGLLGFAVHPATLWRLLGAALMLGGVALVAAT